MDHEHGPSFFDGKTLRETFCFGIDGAGNRMERAYDVNRDIPTAAGWRLGIEGSGFSDKSLFVLRIDDRKCMGTQRGRSF